MSLEDQINTFLSNSYPPVGWLPIEKWIWSGKPISVTYCSCIYSNIHSMIESTSPVEALTSPASYIRNYYIFWKTTNER